MVWTYVILFICKLLILQLTVQQVDATTTAVGGTVFAEGYLTPTVAVDEQGNVYTVDTGLSFETVITKFSPEGALLLQKSYTGVSATGALTYDSTLRLILLMDNGGRIVSITPDQLDVQEFASIDANTLMADNVFDIESGGTTSVTMNMAKFLNLATLHTDASNFLLFVSGCTYPCTFGFVARIKFTNNRIQDGKVVVTSLASTIEAVAGSGPSPMPGVAVNTNGLVITSMAFHVIPAATAGAIEGIVVFGAEFPENNARAPVLLYGRKAETAVAIGTATTDSDGNFYIGTRLASALCGPLMVVSGATLNGKCFRLNPSIPDWFEDKYVRNGIAALSRNNERIVYLALMRILAVTPQELREGNILRVDLTGINLDASNALSPADFGNSSTASIVGGIIGGLCAFGIVVFAIVVYRRHQNQKTRNRPDKPAAREVIDGITDNFQNQPSRPAGFDAQQESSEIPMASIVNEGRPSSPPALPPNKPKIYGPYQDSPIGSGAENRLAIV